MPVQIDLMTVPDDEQYIFESDSEEDLKNAVFLPPLALVLQRTDQSSGMHAATPVHGQASFQEESFMHMASNLPHVGGIDDEK